MSLGRSTIVLLQQSSKYCRPNVRAISTTPQCYRGKINIQRPRLPHYKRALFNAVTQPIYARPSLVEECYQKRLEKQFVGATEKKENPYEDIIADDVFNWLNKSKLVAIFHTNSVSSEDMFKIEVSLREHNMYLKAYGKSIMQKAVNGSLYEPILPLFESKNCVVFSEEPKIGQLLKIVKKAPQLILLAGVVENRLLSKNELVDLSKLPNLTMARAQLVGVLNSAGAGLVGNLEAHQNNLCTLLDIHAKSKSTDADESKNSESTEST